ncbi:xanthine dehydrogenase family protein molybdopterin-binding subunit [Actinomadura kijaniata]|uniref:xanthine dehydrogenase family protein molybdopterin-binding subunit n=1 Tax=Actinomadura kijaniata TaxID=46161 RepID=UPI003F1B9A85
MTGPGGPPGRVDGPAKAAGTAPYPSDFRYPDLAHAVLVRATVAAGRIRRIRTGEAARAPGVLAVVTHTTMPDLRTPPRLLGILPHPPANLGSGEIRHHGQYVAMVVADTLHQAVAAAEAIDVEYAAERPVLDRADPRARTRETLATVRRGHLGTGFTSADVTVGGTYTTAANTHAPIGPFTTTAVWDGDRVTVHDSTQNPAEVRRAVAAMFGIPRENVRVVAPFVGGSFGAGSRVWPHVALAVHAARLVGRPVRLALTRPQMFTGVGHRAATEQRVRLGATLDGRLTAIEHRTHRYGAVGDAEIEPVALVSATSYACPNVDARDERTRVHLPPSCAMRAPGDAQGNFALESAMDELAATLGMDPVELRLRNHADVHPNTGMPWTSRALAECYRVGAERFGWSARDPEPRSARDGHDLVGWGMAGAAFPDSRFACAMSVTLYADGTARAATSTTEIGTGTATVMTRVVARLLGLPVERVTFGFGDTGMPAAPGVGASATTASLCAAAEEACGRLVRELLALAATDPESPLRGARPGDVATSGGRIHLRGDPSAGETYTAILRRHHREHHTVEASSRTPWNVLAHHGGNLVAGRLGAPARAAFRAGRARMPSGACGAHFVEVRVDADLGVVRVCRVVTAVDGGRILDAAGARSQITGAVVGGVGMALMEETRFEPGDGRIANATLTDYLVPVHADVPDIDVAFVGGPDPAHPLGVKGVGEVGLVGVAAAVANAVHHATGIRVRRLPITPERLLGTPRRTNARAAVP